MKTCDKARRFNFQLKLKISWRNIVEEIAGIPVRDKMEKSNNFNKAISPF